MTERNPFDFFDGIICINMDKDLSRWISFLGEAEKMGFADRVIRIPGVYDTVGSYGCAAAHRNALVFAKERGWKNVLVFEDDIKFLYGQDTTFGILRDALSEQSCLEHMLFLGINICPGQAPVLPDKVLFSIPEFRYWGEFAFAVPESMYDELINAVPEADDAFEAMDRGDMVNQRIPYDRKQIVNPGLVSVYGFPTQTGAGIQKDGKYSVKNDAVNIIEGYVKHGMYLDEFKGVLTVIVKTFKRPASLKRFLSSLRDRYPYVSLIIADDSDEGVLSPVLREDISGMNTAYWKLPFNTGVSYGRNFMIDKVENPYFLLCEDDFVFTEHTDLKKLLDFLLTTDADIAGGKVTGSCPSRYVYNIVAVDRCLYYSPVSKYPVTDHVDVISNFFIAKTDTARTVRWKEALKTVEHTEFFLRCKFLGVNTVYLPEVSVDHDHGLDTGMDYRSYRTDAEAVRLFSEVTGISDLKYNTSFPAPSVKKFSCGVFHAYGMSNLAEMTGVLNRMNKKYYVSNGTLLGIIRDDRLIAHDSDLDIHIPVEEVSVDLVRNILRRGFRFVHMFGKLEEGLELSFVKNGVKIDLFCIYPYGSGTKFSLWKMLRRVDYFYGAYRTYDTVWKGIPLKLPCNPEEMLCLEYGPSWRTSDGGVAWDYAWSRHNIIVPEEFKNDVNAYRTFFEKQPAGTGSRVADPVEIMKYLEEVCVER